MSLKVSLLRDLLTDLRMSLLPWQLNNTGQGNYGFVVVVVAVFDFTENLIYTFVICLKFPHQWVSYMYCVVITLSEYNFSCVHTGTVHDLVLKLLMT